MKHCPVCGSQKIRFHPSTGLKCHKCGYVNKKHIEKFQPFQFSFGYIQGVNQSGR